MFVFKFSERVIERCSNRGSPSLQWPLSRSPIRRPKLHPQFPSQFPPIFSIFPKIHRPEEKLKPKIPQNIKVRFSFKIPLFFSSSFLLLLLSSPFFYALGGSNDQQQTVAQGGLEMRAAAADLFWCITCHLWVHIGGYINQVEMGLLGYVILKHAYSLTCSFNN